MRKILLSFEVTRGDLEEFCKSQHRLKRTLQRCLVFGSLWFVVGVAKFLGSPSPSSEGFLFLIVAAPNLGYAIIRPRWEANRIFKSERSWLIFYEIDANGLTIDWIDCDKPTTKWSELKRFRETKNLMILYYDDVSIQVIPKRAFANEADLEQFRAWASGIGQKDAPPIAPIPQP